jgi:hypothetical protein
LEILIARVVINVCKLGAARYGLKDESVFFDGGENGGVGHEHLASLRGGVGV